jgi:hypothetical protein
MTKVNYKKMILDEVKVSGYVDLAKKVKSIKSKFYSGGSSLTVKCVGLTDNERTVLNNILMKYEQGSFDGMTDSYTYSKDRLDCALKYVFLTNEAV